MRITIERTGSRQVLPDGSRISVILDRPIFPAEAPGYERLTSFYDGLIEALRTRAASLCCSLIGEMRVAAEERYAFSLVLDLWFYRGRNAVLCHRFSDNRKWDGTALRPPRGVRKRLPRSGGWFMTPDGFTVYRNPERVPERARRSDPERFSETAIPRTVLTKRERAGTGL